MKKILGLDLGTNSIGWALIEINHENKTVRILGLGSRILPMDAGEIKEFESKGKIKSTAAQRTESRGPRRLNERYLLRRDRLHLVLDLLDALPNHYKLEIDFTNAKGEKSGHFKTNQEPKLAYLPKQEGKKTTFLFMESYKEMIGDIADENVINKKGQRIPYDWTLYYLRQKALSEKISLEELAWVLLSYNQKRGYEKTEVEDKNVKEGELIEELDLRVKDVFSKADKDGKQYFEIHLDSNDSLIYNEHSEVQMTFKNDLKEVTKISKVDEQGNVDDKKTELKIVDIYELKIQDVKYEKDNDKHKYTLTYQNGWIEEKTPVKNFTFKYKNALHKPFDYIVETVYDNEGNVKTQQGKERKLREPDLSDTSNDWTLLKKKTEKEALIFNIEKGYKNADGSAKSYISPNIYNILKNDAKSGNRTKIIGGIFQVVNRDFYREELKQIITTQQKFQTNLEDKKVFEQCVKTLYPKNDNHQESLLKNKDAIQHLLIEDILLYQRPLKSKKSEIANCKYEIRYWKEVLDKKGNPIEETDIETGEIKAKKEPVYIKVVSASHPYFQEFRIWDKLHNLKLIQLEKEVDGKSLTNQDISKEYFKTEKEYQDLFEELNNRKSLNQEQFLSYCKKKFKIDYNKKESNYAWNFPEDEEMKGNETRVSFATRFKRCGFTEYADFLTQKKELELWHYLHSVSYKEKTVNNNKSAVTFFNHYFEGVEIDEDIKEKIINDFVNFPVFSSKYCAYSEKALKKLLPLIRLSNNDTFDSWATEPWYIKWKESLEFRKNEILNRLSKIDFNSEKPDYSNVIQSTVDIQAGKIPFPKGLFNTFKPKIERRFENLDDFSKLNLTQASYLVYGRHSELAQAKYWTSPKDIREQLHQELKQHSLNNPVAEKVLLEMMQVVADIWDYYGEGKENFFSKIHLEVGRELKKSAKEKESESRNMSGNRTQNKRIRQVLEEFLANNSYNANPKNSDHFERLKIAEDGAEHNKNNDRKFFDNKSYSKKDIEDILKKSHITKEDFEKYKLWIEQGYRSPYSGQIIKLTELFDGTKYNVDHIFPQASITNNSLSNKVVVEVALNKLKSDKTARAFIAFQNGQAYLGVPVCTEEEYVNIVKTQFSGTKKMILLSKDIPKGFTSSQLNNTRHIARKAMELLSHIVREPGEIEFRSRNVLPVTGSVTIELKRAWKLEEVWRELVAPRFIRMNELTQSNLFGDWQISKTGQKYFDCNLDESIREKDESYDIKRIDHRHHALDALIVALCTEEHVNYINNINADAKSDNFGKQKQIEKYRQTLKRKIKFTKRDDEKDENNWYYMLPGEIRQMGAGNSRRDSVVEMSYQYKDFDSFGQDYKKMILTTLQDTIVTFKQNLRVINKTVNRYNNTSNKNKFEKQNTDNGQKQNWSIRRSLGKATFYGKQMLEEQDKITIRQTLDVTFNSDKIKTIADSVGRTKAILLNHLKQFDTIELLFEKAVVHLDSLLEKQEFDAIVEENEFGFKSMNDFVDYLRANNQKYKKSDYSKLNVFIEKVTERDFRNKNPFKDEIKEHPEIAFTPEAIEEMNKPEHIRKLNDGKNHKPIQKVKISRGFGNQRALSEDEESVKSKQYVVNDAGSNLYLGVYEGVAMDKNGNIIQDEYGNNLIERKFKDIGLMELLETLKKDNTKRLNPLANNIYDDKQNEYNWKFTLSPLDLVYVPTDEEIEISEKVNFENLTNEQADRIYKYVDGSTEIANFVPYSVSKPIWRFHGKQNKEIFKELNGNGKIHISEKELIQNEFGLGSQQNKNQNMIDGKTQIKKICWKLKIDRLGNISKA
ncbi:MAG: HNH endonuclease domain-containing protein [Flavobacterium sp.]|uniref:type II CRISPR RNA-guided endonuclease Cas9 n=1 Tax=Flavobacterium sp. TaxID=239 RepID=UPI0026335FFD|nr:type II CRISPR RNA-guided endonuclease Cas9 [Flavobacterium sp.]MDD5149523.1 HNH endonuclease domain-containing protein [Flavobacterium sp.]